MVPSSIYNYNILFLIVIKDEVSKVYKLVKINSALDFLKNNTSSASAAEGIIFDTIQDIVFKLLPELYGFEASINYGKQVKTSYCLIYRLNI